MRIDPAPSEWSRLVAQSPGFGSDRARKFREQAGLPTDKPIVMTGHQPVFWHPGILAKFLACDAASSLAAPAWIVPDQDEVDPASIRAPRKDADDSLHVKRFALAPPPPPGVPVASLPPIAVEEATVEDAALPSVRDGLESISNAMATRADADTLAVQAQGAVTELLAPLVEPAPTIFASALYATDLFESLLKKMALNPEPMCRAYNEAVAAHHEAGVPKLIANEVHDRWELPLWRLQPGEPRRRVYAEDALELPRKQLAPRALFMTALLRLAGCDLFIHGAGGEAYDRVTETWIEKWLGERLAPSAVVTATLLLPLRDDIPTDEEVSCAIWRAHTAWHDPGIAGFDDLAQRKRDLVERIASFPRNDPARSQIFREMHALLDEYRETHRETLDALCAEARRLARAAGERDIVQDRTWAFPLYPSELLEGLKADIGVAFTQAGAVST